VANFAGETLTSVSYHLGHPGLRPGRWRMDEPTTGNTVVVAEDVDVIEWARGPWGA
jgi:hypothetical protein